MKNNKVSSFALYNHKNGVIYSCRFFVCYPNPLRKYEQKKETMTWHIPLELQFKVKVPKGKEDKPLNAKDIVGRMSTAFLQVQTTALIEFEQNVLKKIQGKQHNGNTKLLKFMEDIASEYEAAIENNLSNRKSEGYVVRFRDTIKIVEEYLGSDWKLRELTTELFRGMFLKLMEKDISKPRAVMKVDIKALLAAKELSQTDFCVAAGIARPTLHNVIKGLSIEIEKAKQIADELGRPLKELFSIKDGEVRHYKKGSLEKTRSILHSVLNRAIGDDIIDKNYVDPIYLKLDFKEEDVAVSEHNIMNEAETIKALAVIKEFEKVHKPKAACLSIMLWTGMRKSEVAALRVSDIDLENGVIRVSKGRMYVSKQYGITEHEKTKNSKARNVPMSEELKRDMQNYLEWYKNQKALHGDNWQTDGLIVNLRTLKHSTPSSIKDWVEEMIKLAGIDKRITPHKLRHSAGSIMLSNNVAEVSVAAILGHDVSTLKRYYAHAFKEANRRAINQFGNILSGNNVSKSQ